MSEFRNKVTEFVGKNASTIYAVLGSVGVVASSASAAWSAILIKEKLDDISKKEGRELDINEKLRAILPMCIAPTTIGLATIMCLVRLAVINKETQSSLLGAVALASNRYSRYANKIKEKFGEEVHNEVQKEIIAEESSPVSVYSSVYFDSSSVDFEDENEEKHLFYDSFSKRYFESTFQNVLRAEYYLNRNFSLGDIPSLNDFYEFLGIQKTDEGEILVWDNCEGDFYWIDFNHIKTTLDDGMEFWVIETMIQPVPYKA